MQDDYAEAENESKKYIDAIISSTANKKIVVAGPGTGKTHLFKKVLEGKNNALVLSFVNALVEDLSLELYGMADVKTLHSFARSKLNDLIGDVKIFPKLSFAIKQDGLILLNQAIDFDALFHNRNDDSEHIEFYKKRKNYYDKYYGYSDVIFALVKYLEQYKNKIPNYGQVLIDEFQDFNKLEISLIDLLAEKSPILLAGDDDQVLYEELKNADAGHIRTRYGDTQIDGIAKEEKSKFNVLIISPTKVQSRGIVSALLGKGFTNIDFIEKNTTEEPTLLEGLKILMGNKSSNLGWRVISKFILSNEEFETVIKKSNEEEAKPFYKMVKPPKRKEISKMIKSLKAIKNDKEIDEQDLADILRKNGFDPHLINKSFLKEEVMSDIPRAINMGIRKIPIKSTTIQSSKGLSADYVFITHFDDRYFIKNNGNISDKDIRNLLVALTRAKKKVFLISSNTTKRPTFLGWINADRISAP